MCYISVFSQKCVCVCAKESSIYNIHIHIGYMSGREVTLRTQIYSVRDNDEQSTPKSGGVISIIHYVLLTQEFVIEQNIISSDRDEAGPIPSKYQISHFHFKELQRRYLKISIGKWKHKFHEYIGNNVVDSIYKETEIGREKGQSVISAPQVAETMSDPLKRMPSELRRQDMLLGKSKKRPERSQGNHRR